MPTTSNALYGLHKAQSIGADPKAQAWTAAQRGKQEAGMPNPETPGASALSGLLDLAREYSGPVQETLGEHDPMFTPVGGEGLYNVAKGAVRKAGDVADAAYHNILSRMGH